MQIHSNTSTPTGGEQLVFDAVGPSETRPQVVALTGGGFAVMYHDATNSEVWVKTYINTGAPVAGGHQLASQLGANTTGLNGTLTAQANDRFIATWEDGPASMTSATGDERGREHGDGGAGQQPRDRHRRQRHTARRGGNDTLGGGAGADTFILAASIDADRITDHAVGTDALQIAASLWNGPLTQTHLDALASVSGGNLLLDFGGGDTLTLLGHTSTAGLLADITLF